MTARGSLVLEGVSKSFRRYHSRSTKTSMMRLLRGQPLTERRRVLEGVSMRIDPGERVGLLGPNGAGKSTLFRIMSGILPVDEGNVVVTGRVSPLIEITAGLVHDMTGAENIWLNATLLGLTRREIRARFDTIVEFAGLADFLETPVHYYSSGMQARLGFAVGTHVDADILLVDEALSVGDVEFQAKCLGRMELLSRSGVTIVVVSHNEEQVMDFCPRIIRLAAGRVTSDERAVSAS